MNVNEAASESASIGIDIGGTKALGVALTRDGRILAEEKRPTPKNGVGIIECAFALFESLAGKVGNDVNIEGLGVGIAGLVDNKGQLRRAPNSG